MINSGELPPQPHLVPFEFQRASWMQTVFSGSQEHDVPQFEREDYDHLFAFMESTELMEQQLAMLATQKPLFLRTMWEQRQEAIKQSILSSKAELHDIILKIQGIPVQISLEDGQLAAGRVVMRKEGLKSEQWVLLFKTAPDDDGREIRQTTRQLRDSFLATALKQPTASE